MPTVAIRLGVEGGPELKRVFDETGNAAQAAFQKVSAAADQAGAAVDRQTARYQRMAQAAREAEAQARARSNIDNLLGVETGSAGSARSSAAAFEEAFRQESEALRRATEARAEAARTIVERQNAAARTASYQSALNERLGVRTDFGGFGRADDITAYGAELDRVRARFVPLAAAGQTYRRELAEIAQAARAGVISENERAAAVKRTKDAFADQVKEIRSAASATRGLRPDQLQNLSYQAGDVVAQLGSGASLGTILMQQGPQVAGVFGPGTGPREVVSGVVQAIGRFITPLTVTATAITAAAATFAYAASSFGTTQREVRASVTGPGRLSGATPQAINEAAESSARAGEVPVGTARQIAAIYASTGRVDPKYFDDLIKLQRDYAAQTKQDIIPSTEDLAGALSNVATGVDLIESRVGPLGDGVGEAAKRLAAAGDQVGAVKLIVDALPGTLTRANDNLSTFSREWERSGNSLKTWLDLLGGSTVGTGSRTGAETRLAQVEARISSILASQQRYGTAQNATTYEASLQAERQKLAAAQAEVERERMSGPRAQVDYRAAMASRTSGALNPDLMALEQLRAQRSQIEASLRDAVRTDVAPVITGGAGNAYATLQTLNEQIKAIEENYRAGGEAAANALKRADFEKRIAGLSDYERALESIRRKYEELRDAAAKQGDAATREQRIATLNASEAADIATLGTQTRVRARGQIEIPSDYLPMIRAAESSGNDAARSSTGAVGRYQFTAGTWIEMFKREKDALFAEIQSRYGDPRGADAASVRRDVLALRTDPNLQEDLARALTQRNAGELAARGFEVNSRNLYGAHNIGVGGISALLQAQRDGRGDASAQSILDPIDTNLVSANRAYYGNGKSVDEALATLQRKTLANSADARASRERVQAIEGETRALDQSIAQQERYASINEQLKAARDRGEEAGTRFKNAEELLAASAKGLTGELKLQTDAILANADARGRAVQTNLSARFERDMGMAYGSLGRTQSEQAAFSQARLYETPGTARFDAAYDRVRDFQGLAETKGMIVDGATSIASEFRRTGDAASALSNAFGNAADRLLSKALDGAISGGFNMLIGGGSGGSGGSAASVLDFLKTGSDFMKFDGGGYTGPGERFDVAGLVHRGEVVFSQADVARHGGVAAVEVLRRSGGLRGYADGGIVMPDTFTIPSRSAFASDASAGPSFGDITVNMQGATGDPATDQAHIDATMKALRAEMHQVAAATLQRSMGTNGDLWKAGVRRSRS